MGRHGEGAEPQCLFTGRRTFPLPSGKGGECKERREGGRREGVEELGGWGAHRMGKPELEEKDHSKVGGS